MSNPLGLNRRFAFFAVLSSVGSVVLASAVGLGSALIGNIFFQQEIEVPPGSGLITEMVTIFFLTIMIGLVMAVTALPVTLPSSVIVWFVSLKYFSGRVTEKWRIRISAGLSGLAGALGFILLVNWMDSMGGPGFWPMFTLVPLVMVAAIASAEFVYRSARKAVL